jgi:hypothetical protein
MSNGRTEYWYVRNLVMGVQGPRRDGHYDAMLLDDALDYRNEPPLSIHGIRPKPCPKYDQIRI